jgi:hypothetical protein
MDSGTVYIDPILLKTPKAGIGTLNSESAQPITLTGIHKPRLNGSIKPPNRANPTLALNWRCSALIIKNSSLPTNGLKRP